MTTTPRRFVRFVFLLLLCSICFLDYWGYSQEFHKNPGGFLDTIQGRAEAPQQYRILIVRAAYLLQQHSPLVFRYSFTLFDFLAGLVAGFVLLKVLERSAAFRAAGAAWRWFAYGAFLFLFSYYLLWLVWYQRPETLPTTCFVACMLLLLGWRSERTATLLAVAAGTLLLSFVQALTRADVAVCFYVGAFLFTLFAPARVSAPRLYWPALSAAAVIVAAGTQWYIMHHIYPHATYGNTPMIQLRMNLREPLRIAPFLLFVAPVLWTYLRMLRRDESLEPASLALGLGTVLFLPLWLVLGKIDEVRIFLPFAVVLIPATVCCALGALNTSPARDPDLAGS